MFAWVAVFYLGVEYGIKKRSPFKDERKKEDCYLSSSSVNSTIAFTRVVIPIATAIGEPCKAIDKVRIAITNPNHCNNSFLYIKLLNV